MLEIASMTVKFGPHRPPTMRTARCPWGARLLVPAIQTQLHQCRWVLLDHRPPLVLEAAIRNEFDAHASHHLDYLSRNVIHFFSVISCPSVVDVPSKHIRQACQVTHDAFPRLTDPMLLYKSHKTLLHLLINLYGSTAASSTNNHFTTRPVGTDAQSTMQYHVEFPACWPSLNNPFRDLQNINNALLVNRRYCLTSTSLDNHSQVTCYTVADRCSVIVLLKSRIVFMFFYRSNLYSTKFRKDFIEFCSFCCVLAVAVVIIQSLYRYEKRRREYENRRYLTQKPV